MAERSIASRCRRDGLVPTGVRIPLCPHMKSDIESKLQECLKLESISEKDAVYFLVQIYKLMELHRVKRNFPAIFFYRNWAVHLRLDHDSDFKDWLVKIFKNVHSPEQEIPSEVFYFTYFDVLAKEIISFWKKYIFDQEMKSTDFFFKKFRNALIQVIADVPILLQYDGEEVKLVFTKEGRLRIKGPGQHDGEIISL